MVAELKKLGVDQATTELSEDAVVQVYEDVFEGRRRRFPNNFFQGELGRDRAAVITPRKLRAVA